MSDLSQPQKIRDVLHTALGKIATFEQCAFLDYPNYFNIGDHLIWLATAFYLTDVLKAKINYAAHLHNFSDELMEKQIGKAPIILQGGGNFGDTWSHHQKFREYIISKYRDRPIFIMPQCIYFKNPENLARAAAIFNTHPNLTLFVRDNYSYELACKYFCGCQVIKAPDMVFHLVDMPLPSFQFNAKRPILYLCRDDSELNQSFSPTALGIPHLVVQEWITNRWIYRGTEKFRELKEWYWRLPGMVLLVREGWQKGLSNPKRGIAQQQWERFHPYVDKLNALYNPTMHRLSWSMMHAGIYQLLQSRLVITNRLHGHLLCILLGIPHIFLPNAYYKNEAFYDTWTYQISECRFVKNNSGVKGALKELLSRYV
ncbi:MAG: polysaccharide pyruvyl transferase family protein [Coleofasciculaceae cyanobacterium]